MNTKKILPILLLVVLALATFAIKRCNNTAVDRGKIERKNSTIKRDEARPRPSSNTNGNKGGLDRNATDLYFTKHAKCRMKCRHITQQEVKEILAEGTINYNKSDLQNPKGPTYAVEGNTDDGQHVRIIFAPKQRHVSVVTVIDLENEYACNCD